MPLRPMLEATTGAPWGTIFSYVDVHMMTVSISSASMPAESMARRTASVAIIVTVSSGSAKRRLAMPERS